jgi:hypothetical protein
LTTSAGKVSGKYHYDENQAINVVQHTMRSNQRGEREKDSREEGFEHHDI